MADGITIIMDENDKETLTAMIKARVQKTGDTMTGDLNVNTASYPSVRLINSNENDAVMLRNDNHGAFIVARNNMDSEVNYRAVGVINSDGYSDVKSALRLTDMIDGNRTYYKIYGEHNKPTPSEIGAAASSHNQAANTITAGYLGGKVQANNEATATVNESQVRNIYAGTSPMTAGTTTLKSGYIYLQYK